MKIAVIDDEAKARSLLKNLLSQYCSDFVEEIYEAGNLADGVKIIKENQEEFTISKLMPYQYHENELPPVEEAVEAIKHLMTKKKVNHIIGTTEIFIFPGYPFKICKGLITNFHMPKSTLLLLIAAFIGEGWKKIYQEALENEYRFLSYGDSSLLIPG